MGKEKSIKKIVFLDRDGTINIDPGYLNDPSRLSLFPGVPEALKKLKESGFDLAVVSNQSGVARGLVKENELQEIHEKMNALLSIQNAEIDHFALCLHHPDEECECRKPKPKLLLDLVRVHGYDLQHSYMVGDKVSDVEAGQAAGCRASILVKTGYGRENAKKVIDQADFIGEDLIEVVTWILDQEKNT